MSPHYDMAIVGNGVIGLSIARALALRDETARIAVVGPAARPGAASLAAGAMLGCFGEVTDLTLRSNAWREKLELGIAAAKLWDDWLGAINDDLPPDRRVQAGSGTHVITNARSGPGEDANFATLERALVEYEQPHERVDPHDVPGLDPLPGARAFRVIFLPAEGFIRSHGLIAALEDANARRGVELVDAWVDDVRTAGDAFELTRRDGERLQATRVVLAAGAYTQTLLDCFPEVRRRVPHVLAGVGSSMVVSHPQPIFESVVRTPNRAGACGLHAVPYGDGTYLGAANHLQLAPEDRARVRFVTHLLYTGIEQLNASLDEAFMDRVQAGDRPVSLDGLPLIGPTSVEGLWIATGTYRDGLHDSPLIATSIAGEMHGDDPRVTRSFVPERQPIEVLPAAELDELIASSVLGGFAEYSVDLNPPILRDAVAGGLGALVRNCRERLGSDVSLHPDVYAQLVFSDRDRDAVARWLAEAEPADSSG